MNFYSINEILYLCLCIIKSKGEHCKLLKINKIEMLTG